MKRLKRFFIFVSILCLPAVFFSLYTNFLLDYSLDSLELALQVTHKNPKEISTLGRRVYQSVVKDLILEEAFAEKVNYKNLILLELTARSFSESLDRQGYKHAEFYLNEIVRSKLPARHPLLRFLDFIYIKFLNFYRSFSTYIQYVGAQRKAGQQPRRQTYDFSGALLLTQAQLSEEERKWGTALVLYREYLKFYPKSLDHGFVQISMAQILIHQQRLYEAENLLQDVKSEFKGQNEAEISRRLLRKIQILRERQKLVRDLELLLSKPQSRKGIESEFLKSKLAVSYFSLYEFKKSREIFESLSKSKESAIRQKAQFYLVWIHKLSFSLNRGEKIALELLEDPLLDEEMNLSLRAGLADIYYQKKEISKTLAQYDELSKRIGKKDLDYRAIYESWAALSELEQAKIYFYDFGNPEEAKKHLDLAKVFSGPLSKFDFDSMIQSNQNVNLRNLAFAALFQKNVTLALELFLKHLERNPEDAWTHSGIATVYILMGDLDKALSFGNKGFELGPDEYTASVLAYLSSLRRKHKDALIFYRKASRWNRNYLVAWFNLGCVYLTLRKYQEALQVFEKISKLMPMHNMMRAKIFNNIGYAYWGLGRQEKAVESFKEALALSSKSQTAKANLEQFSPSYSRG